MGSQLSRRGFVRGAALTAGAATIGEALFHGELPRGTAAPVPSRSQTFYVSTSGDDSSDGLTPQSAWATIQKVNSALPAGQSVRFRRDEVFFGELNVPFGCDVGAYGAGAKPVMTLYKILNNPDGWEAEAPGVWRIDLGSPRTHGGYTLTNDANIGFLVVNGVVMPALKFALADLAAPWDFYCDIPGHTLYVKAPAKPTDVAADVKAAPNGNAYGDSGTVIYCQYGSNDVHDIHVTGSGGCGIRGSGSDVRVHECLIDYIGGSWLPNVGDGTTRYGNGIEHWPNVSRWTIENNEIAHVYDVAWSTQGRDSTGGTVAWEDMMVRNNHIHDCGQSIELWSESSNPESPGFVRIVFEGNVCERAGYGAFSDVRPDPNVRVHLLTYRLQTPVEVTIQNNVFADAYGAYSYHAVEPPPGYVTRNNIIRLKGGHKMQFQRPETVEQAVAWQNATGREMGSTITVLS